VRSLIDSEAYTRCCGEIDADAPRLDEALRYPLFAIAQHAERFPEVPETKLRRVKTTDFPGAPAMLMFFSIDSEDQCTLWWIEELASTPEVSGSP
jgi:hypothetical protein